MDRADCRGALETAVADTTGRSAVTVDSGFTQEIHQRRLGRRALIKSLPSGEEVLLHQKRLLHSRWQFGHLIVVRRLRKQRGWCAARKFLSSGLCSPDDIGQIKDPVDERFCFLAEFANSDPGVPNHAPEPI
jgi:hypothetical protein